MKRVLVYLFLLFHSCSQVYDFVPDTIPEQELVVYCMLNPDQDTTFLLLSRTFTLGYDLYSHVEEIFLDSAFLVNFQLDTIKFSPLPGKMNKYFALTKGKVLPGRSCHLAVFSTKLGEIYAKTIIPEKNVIDLNLMLDTTYNNSEGYILSCNWTDQGGKFIVQLPYWYIQDDTNDTIRGVTNYHDDRLIRSRGQVYFNLTMIRGEFFYLEILTIDSISNAFIQESGISSLRNNDDSYIDIINPSGYVPDAGNIEGGKGLFGSYVYNILHYEY